AQRPGAGAPIARTSPRPAATIRFTRRAGVRLSARDGMRGQSSRPPNDRQEGHGVPPLETRGSTHSSEEVRLAHLAEPGVRVTPRRGALHVLESERILGYLL